MRQEVQYRIEGLDCAEEEAVLRKELGDVPGVLGMAFDILSGRMTVAYESEALAPAAIADRVARTGMRAIPWESRGRAAQGTWWQRHGRPLLAAVSGLLNLAGLVSHAVIHRSLPDALGTFEGGARHVFPLFSIVCYVGGTVAGAWFVLPKALHALRRLRPDMHLLMTVAVMGAMAVGEWSEAGVVAFLFAVALVLEHWSVGRARRAIESLLDLSPKMARYVCPKDGDIEETRVENVPLGATVIVRPGEKIPLDGVVTKGASTVNQAPITGESMPVPKKPGDEVFAGTINQDGALELAVTRVAADTTLARIINLVHSAQARRAAAQRWVDRFALYYTPAAMALAAGLAFVPPLLFAASWAEWVYRALVVLVIACPCALVISTPVSVVSALTAAARHGVLIKGGMFLEMAGRLKAVALDKTGTLTHGQPEVQEVVPLNSHTRQDLLGLAAALESHSTHPLARAVLRKAREEGVAIQRAESFTIVQGKGAEGAIGGRPYWIGSHRLMEEMGQETPDCHARAEALEDAGHSVVAIGNDQHVCGLVSVADGVRPEATAAVRDLKRLGVRRVVMLTGDNEGTARGIAQATGVTEFRSELLPHDKVGVVKDLVKEHGYVAMVGDGVNDAPAMAVATLGIAMGAMGSDAAIETADIALMADDLSKIPWLVRHSRRTLGVIKQNILFALGLKGLFIALTLFGAASLWMAIAADTGASLLVIANGLRLLRRR